MRCKPGDIAILIESDIPENVGLIVTVVSPYGMILDQFNWYIESKDKQPIKGFKLSTGRIGYASKMIAPDNALQPIRGLPAKKDENESVRDRQTTNA